MQEQNQTLLEKDRSDSISLKVIKKGGKTTVALFIGNKELRPTQELEDGMRTKIVEQLSTTGINVTFSSGDRKEVLTFKYDEEGEAESPVKNLVLRVLREDFLIATTEVDWLDPHIDWVTSLDKKYTSQEEQTAYKGLGVMKLSFSLLAECLLAKKISSVTGTINQANSASVNSRTKAPALLKGGYYPTNVSIEDMTNLVLTTDLTRTIDQPWDYKPPQWDPL